MITEHPPAERSWNDIQAEVQRIKSTPRGPGWHVVHCVGKQDQFVVDVLQRQKYEIYYPFMRELRPLPRKKLSRAQRAAGAKVMRPQIVRLFPRYPFVYFDLGTTRWREIFDIAGVGGMICEGNLPVRMDATWVEKLRTREVDGAVPGTTPADLIFAPGDQVRVDDGPFAGHLGVVEAGANPELQDVDSETRIRVAVSIFGRPTPIDLDLAQVSKS